jgi:hypothetical protein
MPESSQPRLSVTWLLDLSRELSNVLVLLHLRPEFRDELHRHLVAEARRQQALRTLSLPGKNPGRAGSGPTASSRESDSMGPRSQGDSVFTNKRWIIGTAVGSASALGLLVLVRSRRHRSAA